MRGLYGKKVEYDISIMQIFILLLNFKFPVNVVYSKFNWFKKLLNNTGRKKIKAQQKFYLSEQCGMYKYIFYIRIFT